MTLNEVDTGIDRNSVQQMVAVAQLARCAGVKEKRTLQRNTVPNSTAIPERRKAAMRQAARDAAA